MEFYEQTMQACRDYLLHDPHVKNCFEKLDVSASRGFMYEYEQDGRRILLDLRVEEILPLVTLFAHADVLIKKEKAAVAAKYCQMHSSPSEPGMLMFSPTHGYAGYRITTTAIEAPVSEKTLAWMTACACEKIAGCRDDLGLLANDDWNPRRTEKIRERRPESERPAFPEQNLQETKKRLTEGFKDSDHNHNALGQGIDEADTTLFFNQIMTENEIFHERISVDRSGCLVVAVRPEFVASAEQLGKLALYCNEVCSRRKTTRLHAYCRDGHVWSCAAISLWDGPIGKDSVDFAEMFAIKEAHDVLEKTLAWTDGRPDPAADSPSDEGPEADEKRPNRGRRFPPRDMMDILRENHPDDTEPERPEPDFPEPDGDDPFAEAFSDFGRRGEESETEENPFTEEGVPPDFESLFAEEDGELPDIEVPIAEEEGGTGASPQREEDDCLTIPGWLEDEDE